MSLRVYMPPKLFCCKSTPYYVAKTTTVAPDYPIIFADVESRKVKLVQVLGLG
jgi:hypothetical protein